MVVHMVWDHAAWVRFPAARQNTTHKMLDK